MHLDPTPAAGASAPGIAVVASVAPYAAGKSAWFVDIWGVMHNGVEPFLSAAAACQSFRAAGGTVVLLSNAPRPAASVEGQLARIGVPRDAWDFIVTSGDAARAMVTALDGRPVYHLGPERDRGIYEGAAVTLAEPVRAEAIVCTGLFDDETETPDDYRECLEGLVRRGLPMVCVNPDLTVERGGRIIYCAGAIAAEYARLGGTVSYAGKPYLPVYDMTFAALARHTGRAIAAADVLAIGDGVNTDIAGAATAGIDSIYIASGVHLKGGARLDAAGLGALFPNPAIRPVAAMTALAW